MKGKNMNPRPLLLFLFSTLLLIACAEKKDAPVPDEILQPADMQSILTEMHLADAAIQNQSLTGDTVNKLYSRYYSQIFSQHKINRDQFEKSFDYYCAHGDKLDEIYGQIINDLSKKSN